MAIESFAPGSLRSASMTSAERTIDVLRRQTDRALATGDRFTALQVQRRLCAACGATPTTCAVSQRRACRPILPA
jgi:hypothetical protein